jgi:hypothetical protein
VDAITLATLVADPRRLDDATDAVSELADATDRMHGMLMDRADALMGCTENSPEEAELAGC